MSDWARFWDLIEVGRRAPEELRRRIAAMSEAELVKFYWTYEDTAADLWDEDLTGHLDPPLSEDGLDDVAHWAVAQGLDYYESLMMKRAQLPRHAPAGEETLSWTGRVMRVYWDRYGAPVRYRDQPPPEEPRHDAPAQRG